MMTDKLMWVKLPVDWINNGNLKKFSWKRGEGSANVAALMLLIAIAHHVDKETGVAKLTYNDLQQALSLSRTKISEGLRILEKQGLVTVTPGCRSAYQLEHYGKTPWGKLPAKGLYKDGVIAAFSNFTLRHPMELRALKIYLFLIAKRNNITNFAAVSYDVIREGTGVGRSNIKPAIGLLILNTLAHPEKLQREDGEGYYNSYRISYIDPYKHMGTSGGNGGIREI